MDRNPEPKHPRKDSLLGKCTPVLLPDGAAGINHESVSLLHVEWFLGVLSGVLKLTNEVTCGAFR